MLKNYLKVAFRSLYKNYGFTLINVFGLTFGITCFIFIAGWVWNEYNYDRFHEKGDRIYKVMAEMGVKGESSIVPYAPSALVELISDNVPEVNNISRVFPGEVVFDNSQIKFSEKGIYADPSFLNIFSFPLAEGELNNLFTKPNAVVISSSLAAKYFPEASALGKTIFLTHKENEPYTVSGVLQEFPSQSSLKFDFILPYQQFEDRHRPWWKRTNKYSFSNYNVEVYFEAVEGSDQSVLNEKLTAVLDNHSVAPGEDALFTVPFSSFYLNSDFSNGRVATGKSKYLQLLSLVAVLILLIACINFINLYTAMMSNRAKEIGLRKVVGARKAQVVFQFLTESIIISIVSTILAITCVEIFTPVFEILSQKQITLPYSSPIFLILVFGGSILIGILAGLYPSIQFSSANIIAEVKAGASTALRKYLVVIQFTLSIVFIVFTLVVFNQVNFIKNKDLGIRKTNIIKHALHDIRGKQSTYRNELLYIPGVKSVTFTEQSPVATSNKNNGVFWPGKIEESTVFFNVIQVGADYCKTFDIKLKSGGSFQENFNSEIKQVLINEEAAKLMALEEPVGTALTVWGYSAQIVGVVNNYHHMPLTQAIEPVVILYNPEETWNAYINVDGRQMQEHLAGIKQVYERYEANHPFDFAFLDQEVAKTYDSLTLISRLSIVFTIVALIISYLGLFGLSAFLIQKRSKEAGIRKVMGAGTLNLIYLFTTDFIKLVLIALALAVPVAWVYSEKWLAEFTYHAPLNFKPFLLAGVAAIAIAILSVLYNTLKASLSNPATTLKEE